MDKDLADMASSNCFCSIIIEISLKEDGHGSLKRKKFVPQCLILPPSPC